MAAQGDLADKLKALSTPVRVRIVELLKNGPLCVGALAARLAVTQGAVSQHLRILRAAGVVTAERQGYHIHYTLNRQTLTAWKKEIDELLTCRRGDKCCCQGLPEMKGQGQCQTKTSTPAKPKASARSPKN
jgi:DNA-binding transcriptional ArsR family regulator